MKHSVDFGDSPHGNMVRLENCLEGFERKQEKLEDKLSEYQRNLEQSKEEFNKPFTYEGELASKLKRQFELNAELDMDKGVDEVLADEDSFKVEKEVVNESGIEV